MHIEEFKRTLVTDLDNPKASRFHQIISKLNSNEESQFLWSAYQNPNGVYMKLGSTKGQLVAYIISNELGEIQVHNNGYTKNTYKIATQCNAEDELQVSYLDFINLIPKVKHSSKIIREQKTRIVEELYPVYSFVL